MIKRQAKLKFKNRPSIEAIFSFFKNLQQKSKSSDNFDNNRKLREIKGIRSISMS